MARNSTQAYRVPYYVSDRGTVHLVKDKFKIPSDWLDYYLDEAQLPQVQDPSGGGNMIPGSSQNVEDGIIEDTAFEIIKNIGFTGASGAAYPVRPGLGFPDFYKTAPTCNDSDFEPRKLIFTRRIGEFSVVAPAPYDLYVNVTGQALTNFSQDEQIIAAGVPPLFSDPYTGRGFSGFVFGVRRVATAIYNYINRRYPGNPITCIKLVGEKWPGLQTEMLSDVNDPAVALRIAQSDAIPGFDTTPIGNYRNGKQHRFSGVMFYESQSGFAGYDEAELSVGQMMARPKFRTDRSAYLMESNYPTELNIPPIQFFPQITGIPTASYLVGGDDDTPATLDLNLWMVQRSSIQRDLLLALRSGGYPPGCIWFDRNPVVCPGRDSLVPKRYIVTYVTQEERPANSRGSEAPGSRQISIPVSGGRVELVCRCGKALAANPSTICLDYQGESDDQLHKKLGLFGITCSSSPEGRANPPGGGGGGGGGGLSGNPLYGPSGGGLSLPTIQLSPQTVAPLQRVRELATAGG
jgi:hypothetical protein